MWAMAHVLQTYINLNTINIYVSLRTSIHVGTRECDYMLTCIYTHIYLHIRVHACIHTKRSTDLKPWRIRELCVNIQLPPLLWENLFSLW